ncbi:MAG: hypothetical protein EB010_12115 [Acidimicrobiia bacterium]|nr:hypothetical protein [Acidimicrobiia bacterium]
MIEHVPWWWPIAGYALGFAMGASSGARFRFYGKFLRRLRMGPPKGSYGPRQPEQPLAADLIRYSRWRSEQIERALRDEPPTPN